MLQPDHRVLLTEALRPPVGFSVDHAVATTYTLGLTATLIAPMTFAAAAAQDVLAEVEQPSIHMLDAVQRYVDRTTVFVQAGGIHVPQSHSRVLTFLEDSIHEVEPPEASGTFHPKIWAVRYYNESNEHHHRLIISSRNLTLDNSWDTILVLDEDPAGTIDAQPAAAFLAALPQMTIRDMTGPRKRHITDLAESMAGRSFSTPAEYTHGRLLPMGVGLPSWQFPTDSSSALVISPFLSPAKMQKARPSHGDAILVSRAESMDELGKDQLGQWQTRVLHAALDDPDDDDSVDDEVFDELSGLHAKTAIYDVDNAESVTVTGSANFTNAAWQRNVEFNAVLYGPTAQTGTEAILGQEEGQLGLSSIIEPYEPAQHEPITDTERQLRYEIEQFHRQLARTEPVLDLSIIDQHTVSALLRLTVPDHKFLSKTRLWLSTTPDDKRRFGDDRPWEIAPVNVTSFLAVETTVGSVVRRCILTCRLTGEAVDRRRAALAAMLSSPDRVLQYIALLMGVDSPGQIQEVLETDEQTSGITLPATAASQGAQLTKAVLFEPLMHATRNPQELAKIARQIEELRSLPTADELIPADFLNMWDTVVAATLTGGTK
jgi:hypothetical protein